MTAYALPKTREEAIEALQVSALEIACEPLFVRSRNELHREAKNMRWRTDDRALSVEALTPELRERGRVPNGTPARFAVVQRNGRGELMAVKKLVIAEEEGRIWCRVFAALDEGRYEG